MARTRQSGFTLPEILIAVCAMLILGTTAVSSFKSNTEQARISRGMSLSAGVKAAVNEFYSQSGKFPTSNSMAGLREPGEIQDAYVKSIAVGGTPHHGTITINYRAYGSISAEDTLLLIPVNAGFTTDWVCRSRTLLDDLLPTRCS